MFYLPTVHVLSIKHQGLVAGLVDHHSAAKLSSSFDVLCRKKKKKELMELMELF